MTFLDKLERNFGRFAIPGLIRYVVMLNALVFILLMLDPKYVSLIDLNAGRILQGEVWRLFTWIFIPPAGWGMLGFFLYMWFTFFLGDTLEATWGSFRLNLFYLLGFLGNTAAAFLLPGESYGNPLLNTSLFFAVATLAPNYQILVMFIIPMKLKWVALISVVFVALAFLGGSLAAKAAILISLVNYFLFFGPQFIRNVRDSQSAASRRAKFEAAKMPSSETLHRCSVCGITEVTAPNADFRVAEDGNEYCLLHLPQQKV